MRIAGLVGWFLVTFAAALIGSIASIRATEFYGALEVPSWAPPGSVFGPVWTVLYVLMAVAAWLVWRAHGWQGARTALTLFLIQLAANALWSWLFFAWRLGLAAFIELVVLWGLIVATIISAMLLGLARLIGPLTRARVSSLFGGIALGGAGMILVMIFSGGGGSPIGVLTGFAVGVAGLVGVWSGVARDGQMPLFS